jgi:predicted hydrolase (HD superfamily)
MSRDEAYSILTEYTQSESLIGHDGFTVPASTENPIEALL